MKENYIFAVRTTSEFIQSKLRRANDPKFVREGNIWYEAQYPEHKFTIMFEGLESRARDFATCVRAGAKMAGLVDYSRKYF